MIFQYLRRRSFKGFLIQLRSNNTPFRPFWSHYLRMLRHKLHIWGKMVLRKFFSKQTDSKMWLPRPRNYGVNKCEQTLIYITWKCFHTNDRFLARVSFWEDCLMIFLLYLRLSLVLSPPTVAPTSWGHNVINLNLHTPGCFHIRLSFACQMVLNF